MVDKAKENIAALLEKAAAARAGIDAVSYSQAALNAANAVLALVSAEELSNGHS